MEFYRHWARATEAFEKDRRTWRISRHGWSNASLDDARAKAQQLVEQTAEMLRLGGRPERYAYADRPLREEIVDEITENGAPVAVITRNAYGSLVLNTSSVMFADIDDPAPNLGASIRLAAGFVGRLFGKKGSPPEGTPSKDEVRVHVESVVANARDLGLRLYRTAGGYRCLITSATYDPTGRETADLLAALRSDPLYVKLCGIQECFRARLSPKFWRCGATRPPARFPWANASRELAMREWEVAYHALADPYATCHLVAPLGSGRVAPGVDRIVALHDEFCCREGAPLA